MGAQVSRQTAHSLAQWRRPTLARARVQVVVASCARLASLFDERALEGYPIAALVYGAIRTEGRCASIEGDRASKQASERTRARARDERRLHQTHRDARERFYLCGNWRLRAPSLFRLQTALARVRPPETVIGVVTRRLGRPAAAAAAAAMAAAVSVRLQSRVRV